MKQLSLGEQLQLSLYRARARAVLAQSLRRNHGSVAAAARELAVPYRTVWRWLRLAGLEPGSYRR